MKLKKYYCFALVCVVTLPLLCYGQIVYAAPFLSKDNHTKKVIPIQQKKANQAVHQYNKKNKKPPLKAEADQSAVWSNAFTFQKVWGTQVDPRTGIFSAWLQVGSLVSNMNRGPNINLNVNYSTGSLANPDGLGIGWSWNLTHFNPLNDQLTTSQGQSFQLRKIDKEHWWPRYHKLKDIRIDGSKKSHFVITYANALRETLNHDGYETRLEQQDGRGVNFDYLPGTHLLSRITDDSGHKILLTYNDNYIKITSYSIDGSPLTRRINCINKQLRTVSFPVTNITDYKTVHLNYKRSLLSKIIYPTGLIKTMDYNCSGAMKLPTTNNQMHTVCVVTKTDIIPGFGQPEMTTTYTYNDTNANQHNYLAYNSGLSFLQNSGQDILFSVPGHYTYKTTTDNGIVKELRTYNKYHLLIDTKTLTDNDNRVLTETQNFFCRTDVNDGCAETSFEQLLATYDRPLKTVTKIWSNNPDEPPLINSIIRRYDDQGRLLMSKDSYGHKQQITYCFSDNNTSIPGCPKEPEDWSVVSLVHSTTTSVPGSGLPTVSKYVNYRKQPNLNGKDYMLIESDEQTYAGAYHISTKRQYYNDPTNIFTYGLLKKTSFYQNLTANSNNKPIIKYYYYRVNADHSVRTSYSETVLDADKDTRLRSMSISSSLFTNQLLSDTDAEGKNTNYYFYDLLGRIIRIDVAAGTPFATSRYYDYTISPTLNQVLTIAGNGLKSKIIFDAAGRKLKNFDETISDTGKAENKWRITWSKIYDSHGHIAAEYSYTPYNINGDEKRNAVYKTISLMTTAKYDNIGRIITLYLPDGEKIIRQYDDGKRCIINYKQDLYGHNSAISVIRNNVLGKPVKQILLPSMQHPLATKLCAVQAEKIPGAQITITTRDRYGRPISVTDPAGKIISTHYDALGRVTDMINSNGDRIHNIYNINNQVVEKWAYPVNSNKSYLISCAAYDAAGRLLWKAGEDGKKTHFTYMADGQVATKTTPTGHVISWQYNIPGLPVHEWLDGKTILQIDYDHTVVLPIKKYDITGITTFAYNDDGKLKQINRYGKNGYPDYHLQWHYNPARQVIFSLDISGNTLVTKYDKLGRTTQVFYKMKNNTEEMLYQFVYDGFSRVDKIYHGSRINGKKNSMRTIKYDQLGRQNDIADFTEPDNNQNKQQFFEEKYTYDADNNIIKIIENGRADQSATLQYQYDKRNNLAAMYCTGSAGLPLCPRDTAFAGAGTKEAPIILSQHYMFNDLNRIVQVTEQLSDVQQRRSLNKVMSYTYEDAKAPLRLQQISTAWNNQAPVSKQLSYADSGNMIIDGEGNHVTYNAFNQITSVVMPDGKQKQYAYDGGGRKVSETSSTGDVSYLLYMNKTLLGEQIGRPGATHMISYLGVAKAVDGVLDEFYGRNYKGDVITVMHKVTSDNNGQHAPLYTLKQYNIYSPYGMKWHKNSAKSLPLYQQTLEGFNGTRTDPLTGWQFLGAGHRTYSATQRYFLSEDPAGDGYAFCGNNPIMNNDPDGNLPKYINKTFGGIFNLLSKVTSFGISNSKSGLRLKAAIWTVGMIALFAVSVAVTAYLTGSVSIPLVSFEAGTTAAISISSIGAAIQPDKKGWNIASTITGTLAIFVAGYEAASTVLNFLFAPGSLALAFSAGESAVGEELLEKVSVAVDNAISRDMTGKKYFCCGEQTLEMRSKNQIIELWSSLQQEPTIKGVMDNDVKNMLVAAKNSCNSIEMKSFKLLIGLKLRVLNNPKLGDTLNQFYNAIITKILPSNTDIPWGEKLTNLIFFKGQSTFIRSAGNNGEFSDVLTLVDNMGTHSDYIWERYIIKDTGDLQYKRASLSELYMGDHIDEENSTLKVYNYNYIGLTSLDR